MKQLLILLSLAAVLALAGCKGADDKKDAKLKLDTDIKKLSYAIGYSIGKRLASDKLRLDIDVFSRAVKDARDNQKPAMPVRSMMAEIQKYRQTRMNRVRARLMQRRKGVLARKKLGEDFLTANSKKKGVVTRKSGLQYRVLKAGTGKSPKPTDTVIVHYTGKLVDGRVFDSSIKRNAPAEFRVNGVIRGWQEVLPLMKEGARWEVFIPYQLAYGRRGAGRAIGPYEMLVFEINLIKVK
jgi:FKBP-type peptidyl-prolyl cis-trans isomerase FklB